MDFSFSGGCCGCSTSPPTCTSSSSSSRDLFRDEETSGWLKAVWIIFLVFVPFLTALVYIIARGNGMAARAAAARGYATVSESDDYRPKASASPAEDIARRRRFWIPAPSARASTTPSRARRSETSSTAHSR